MVKSFTAELGAFYVDLQVGFRFFLSYIICEYLGAQGFFDLIVLSCVILVRNDSIFKIEFVNFFHHKRFFLSGLSCEFFECCFDYKTYVR